MLGDASYKNSLLYRNINDKIASLEIHAKLLQIILHKHNSGLKLENQEMQYLDNIIRLFEAANLDFERNSIRTNNNNQNNVNFVADIQINRTPDTKHISMKTELIETVNRNNILRAEINDKYISIYHTLDSKSKIIN